jgi:hypothetical protein
LRIASTVEDDDDDGPIIPPSKKNDQSKIQRKGVIDDDEEEWMCSESDNDSSIVELTDDDDEDDDHHRTSKRKANRLQKSKSSKKVVVGVAKPPLPKAVTKGSAIASPSPSAFGKTSASPFFSSTPTSQPYESSYHYVTPSPNSTRPTMDSSLSQSPDTSASPSDPMPLPEGVMGRGSHEHNSFSFLFPANRRDKVGKKMTDPDYNPRTLHIPDQFMKDQTPAMHQWWLFKSENMDTVLFFKVSYLYILSCSLQLSLSQWCA